MSNNLNNPKYQLLKGHVERMRNIINHEIQEAKKLKGEAQNEAFRPINLRWNELRKCEDQLRRIESKQSYLSFARPGHDVKLTYIKLQEI